MILWNFLPLYVIISKEVLKSISNKKKKYSGNVYKHISYILDRRDLSVSLKSCLHTKSEIHPPPFISNQRRLQDVLIFFLPFPVYLLYSTGCPILCVHHYIILTLLFKKLWSWLNKQTRGIYQDDWWKQKNNWTTHF